VAVVQYTFTHKQHTEQHKTNNTQNNTKQTTHRTTQNKQHTEQHKTNSTQNNTKIEECQPCPVFVGFTLAFALQLRKNHGKASVRVEKPQSESIIKVVTCFDS